MMRTLRDKRTIQIVIWSLVVVFVATIFFTWGMRNYSSQNDDRSLAAKVGDQKITSEEFNSVYKNASEQLYQSDDNPTDEETQQLRKKVLNGLIDNAILELTAKKLGFSVSNDEVIADIQHMPYFLDKNRKFDEQAFKQFLQNSQMTETDFLETEKHEILLDKIRGVLAEGVLFTPSDVQSYARFLNRDLKADYVELSMDRYEKGIAPSESQLKDFYETVRSEYDHPERGKFRVIYIAAPTDSPLDLDKTQKALEDYRSQVISGKSTFANLAKKYSQDGSRDSGGELGWIPRQNLPPELESKLFDLKKGGITSPFKFQSGYFIFQMEDYEKEYKSTFEEVRSKITKQYQMKKAGEKLMALSAKLSQKLGAKEAIAKAADELGLSLKSTSWFNRRTGIDSIMDSKNAADRLAGLYPDEWRGPLSIGTNEYFFQITSVRPSQSISAADDLQMTQRLSMDKQDLWLRDFLDAQRKKLDIKTFING